MEIIFRDKYVSYNQIFNISLMEIHDMLIENDISIELGDGFCNDWGGFAYWYISSYCKSIGKTIDKETISSFVYIITWFMTSIPIEINPNAKSSRYYKNDKILMECLKIYDDLINKYDSEVDICDKLLKSICHFYIDNHRDYLKKSERMNCLLTFEEMKLFDNIDGNSRSDKLTVLLNNYYNLD